MTRAQRADALLGPVFAARSQHTTIVVEPNPLDRHPVARITTPVVPPPDDYAVLRAVERLLNPNERRRFRFLWREAVRGGAGVRPAIKIALRRQMDEVTVRLEAAMRETGR